MDPTSTNQEFDEYGFLISRNDPDGSNSDERCHSYSPQPSEDIARQWREALDSWPQINEHSPEKLRQLLRKGLPQSLRSRAWQLFLHTNTLRANSTFNYQTRLCQFQSQLRDLGVSEYSGEQDIRTMNHLLEQSTCNDGAGLEEKPVANNEGELRTLRQIMLDIGRSYPTHQLFMAERAAGRSSLLHILALYAAYNPKVGYCQGMAYVGGLLLMSMEEEDAFWAMMSLFESPKYLAGYYDATMSRLQTHASVLGLMLRDRLPQLAAHLDELGIHPLLYVTPWFMCVFTSLPRWDTVLTICDLLFLDGIETIFKVALAVMSVCEAELVAMHRIEWALPFLQHLPDRLVTPGHLLPALWRTTLSKREVVHYLDSAHNQTTADQSVVGRPCRKRPAPNSCEDTDSPQTAKRQRRDPQTPAAVKPSLLTRLKNVFTPAKTPLTIKQNLRSEWGTLNNCSSSNYRTPMTHSSRKRKRVCEDGENFDLSVHHPSIQSSGTIELTDFSAKMSTPQNKLFRDSPKSMSSPLYQVTPLLESKANLMEDSQRSCSPRGQRRSIRIAKRRSTCQHGASPIALPSMTFSSPMSVHPLQDKVLNIEVELRCTKEA